MHIVRLQKKVPVVSKLKDGLLVPCLLSVWNCPRDTHRTAY